MRARASLLLALLPLAVAPAAATAAPPVKKRTTDKSPPVVAIGAPADGATLGGSVTVSGTASDNVALSRVEVSVDGGSFAPASGTADWSAEIDTRGYADGSHTIAARATDGSGRTATAAVTVVFSNPGDSEAPSVAIVSPEGGATVDRAFTVAGTASDSLGVERVEVRLDDGAWQQASGTSSWSAHVDASGVVDGPHVVVVRATDPSGNASSAGVEVHVSDDAVASPPMAAGTIGGYAFQETDRDGVLEAGERRLAAQNVRLYDASGSYLKNTTTDENGWYAFTGLPDGAYHVRYAPLSWWEIREDWVPDTTGSLLPRHEVTLNGTARADFGWRPIVRSADSAAPFSSYTAPGGLEVKSYDDVVSAREVHDRLMGGSLVGVEAASVTIRFDYTTAGSTSSMAMQSNGEYTYFHATSNISYVSWLDGDNELFHEYGHAWSLYFAYMVQGDPTLAAYLRARGLAGDSRVGSSYVWNSREMIAEDYRQLFGSPSAREGDQMNRDIPPAAEVAGLREFLRDTFTRPPA